MFIQLLEILKTFYNRFYSKLDTKVYFEKGKAFDQRQPVCLVSVVRGVITWPWAIYQLFQSTCWSEVRIFKKVEGKQISRFLPSLRFSHIPFNTGLTYTGSEIEAERPHNRLDSLKPFYGFHICSQSRYDVSRNSQINNWWRWADTQMDLRPWRHILILW